MKRAAWLVIAAAAGVSAVAAEVRFVDSFDLSGAMPGLGAPPRARASVDGRPLSVAGKVYERGFGARPECAVLFRLDGGAAAFDALVGVDDGAADAGHELSYGKPTVRFRVWADGAVAWDSGDVKVGQSSPVAAPRRREGGRARDDGRRAVDRLRRRARRLARRSLHVRRRGCRTAWCWTKGASCAERRR